MPGACPSLSLTDRAPVSSLSPCVLSAPHRTNPEFSWLNFLSPPCTLDDLPFLQSPRDGLYCPRWALRGPKQSLTTRPPQPSPSSRTHPRPHGSYSRSAHRASVVTEHRQDGLRSEPGQASFPPGQRALRHSLLSLSAVPAASFPLGRHAGSRTARTLLPCPPPHPRLLSLDSSLPPRLAPSATDPALDTGTQRL